MYTRTRIQMTISKAFCLQITILFTIDCANDRDPHFSYQIYLPCAISFSYIYIRY